MFTPLFQRVLPTYPKTENSVDFFALDLLRNTENLGSYCTGSLAR